MSEGRVTIGALILFAAWLFVGLPWLLTPSERVEYRETSQASAHGTQNQPNGTVQSPYFVQVIPAPKSAQERADEAQDREEKKSSDWWLVRWTFALFAATIGLILATAVLGYFGWRQSRDMQDSIAVANRSATAAERALIDLERPWLFVHLSPHLVDRKAPPEFKVPPVAVFQIGNHGRMPATIRACYIALEGLPQTEPSAGLLRDEFHMSIGPQERSEKLPIDCPGGLAEYGAVVDLITDVVHPIPELKQTENLFFYIVIEYVDVRGKLYKSSFCWRFDLGVNYWVEFGGSKYNYLT
ncbi:hypothetical protein [Bradyrhizobium sp. SZCCHNR1070]|uniref:hypothetical protein n=1 Tax=Bradyrhizobium sp. SZCCHNR1070 TaxID=3057361 RepID=UPI0029164D95|nr:hypothetical protein [Bradyrhizobium sp. SZCCHNR1070]